MVKGSVRGRPDALDQRVLSFNVESEAELDYISQIASAKNQRAPIALRVNPDVEAQTHQYISTGKSENKFGIALDQLPAVYERAAKMRNIKIGNFAETVVERADYPPERIKAILGQETFR